MTDERQSREDAIFREEMAKQKEAQTERTFLKDKSIGGANVPRPTDAYIDKSLGNSIDRMEQAHEAGKRAGKRIKAEEAAEKRQEKLGDSIRMHERNRLATKAKRLEQRATNPGKKRDDFEK